MNSLERNSVFLPDDVQQTLRKCAGHIIAYPHAYAFDAEQGDSGRSSFLMASRWTSAISGLQSEPPLTATPCRMG